jgi:hypothetical protein
MLPGGVPVASDATGTASSSRPAAWGFDERGITMIVPAEKELRAVLARFAQARIEHDVLPTGYTSQALEDSTYTLCVMTGARTADQALVIADALLERYAAGRENTSQESETLAA